MMWFINFIRKRPTDKTIRFFRIIFWLILILSLYYNLIFLWKDIDNRFLDFSIFGYVISNWFYLWEQNMNILKYVFVSIWIVPVIMWIFKICLLKKNYMKIVQIAFSFILFYLASIIESSPDLDIDTLIWLMALLPLFAWITWKCIISDCLKYKEKITKIRV